MDIFWNYTLLATLRIFLLNYQAALKLDTLYLVTAPHYKHKTVVYTHHQDQCNLLVKMKTLSRNLSRKCMGSHGNCEQTGTQNCFRQAYSQYIPCTECPSIVLHFLQRHSVHVVTKTHVHSSGTVSTRKCEHYLL